MYVYLNSRLVPAQAALVSVFDRGFAYGDALFETGKILSGRPAFFAEHFQRLTLGMEAAGITGALDFEGLKNQALSLAEANSVISGRLRVQVTRGTPPAPGGPDPDQSGSPTLLVTAQSFAYPGEIYRRGICCRTVPFNRGHFASIKSTNLLGSVLAREAARQSGAREAIFTTAAGRMLEGSYSNIFFIRAGTLLTAGEEENILAGVTRAKLLKLAAKLGFETRFEAPSLRELNPQETAAFLTGSVLGVCPVCEIDGTAFDRDTDLVPELSSRLAALEEESIR